MRVGGREANYHKLVFEVRYDGGLTYLDRCGTTANRIMATDPAWVLRGENVSPQGAPLVNATSGTQLNFGVYKYDFALDQPEGRETALSEGDINTFISQVGTVSPILHEELSLTRFLRKGFRVWFVFAAESERESNQWIRTSKAVSVSASFANAFGAELESQSYAVVLRGEDRKYRVSVNPVERLERIDIGPDVLRTLPRNLPKNQRAVLLEQARARQRLRVSPDFAVMIDVDVFVDEPIEIDAASFIRQSLEQLERSLPQALGGQA